MNGNISEACLLVVDHCAVLSYASSSRSNERSNEREYTISLLGCVFGEQRGGAAEILSRIVVEYGN